MPRIENWYLSLSDDDPYLAPELRQSVVVGEVYDDERRLFSDGNKISTGTICFLMALIK